MATKKTSNGTDDSKIRRKDGRRPRAGMLAAVGALIILVALGLLPATTFTASAAPAGQSDVATQSAANVCSDGFYACWMGNNGYWLGQRPLNQVIMPGSHDTGTYGFGSLTYERTQDSDLYTQLVAGAREFDIRAKPSADGSKLVINHGGSNSDLDLQSLFDGLARFTKSPGAERELIYIKMSDGGNDNAQLYQRYCNDFTNTFGGIVLTPAQLLATDAGAVQAGAEQTFRSLNEIWALPNQPRIMVDWGRCGRSTVQYGDYYANQVLAPCISYADGYALNGRRNQQETGGEAVPYNGCLGIVGLGSFVPGVYVLYAQQSGFVPGLGTSIEAQYQVLRAITSWYRDRTNSAPGYLNYISGDFIDHPFNGVTVVSTAVALNLPTDTDRYAGGPQIAVAQLAPLNGQVQIELTCHLPSGLGGSLKQLNQPDSADNPQRSTLIVTDPQAGASFQCRDNSNRVARLVLDPVTATVGPVVPDPRNSAVASVAIAFDRDVTGVTLSDLQLTRNGNPVALTGATLTGSGASYTLGNLTGLTTTNGAYTLTLVASGSGIESATDSNFLVTNASDTWTMDTVGPTVTIVQASGQADPTSAGPILFTAVFSKPVTGFSGADINFTGSTTPGTLTATVSGSGTTYTVSIGGMTGSGTVVASIPGSVATDLAGNGNAAATFTFKYDATPPTGVVGTPDRPANTNGWYNAPVTVTFSGTDAMSGIASCTSTTYSGPDSAAASVSGTCTDKAGNTSAPASFTFKYDTTAPTNVVGTPDRGPDSNGWYNHAVTVSLSTTDTSLSGIASCTSTTYSGPDSAAATVAGSCTDTAGNVGQGSFGPIKIDTTAPTVTYTGNAGTYTVDQMVSITCTALDNLSGVASSTCQNITAPAYSFALGANTFTATATDKAGNAMTTPTSTSFTVTVSATALNKVIGRLVTNPSVAASLQEHVNAIASAPNANAKAGKLNAFINAVNAQTGKSITSANAAILIALAKAL